MSENNLTNYKIKQKSQVAEKIERAKEILDKFNFPEDTKKIIDYAIGKIDDTKSVGNAKKELFDILSEFLLDEEEEAE